MKNRLLFLLVILISSLLQAQETLPKDYLALRWTQVATNMPEEWYGTEAAKEVADNVLISQKDIGGWAKNKPYHHHFTESEKAEFIESKSEVGATFDNGSTITELRFLAKMYAKSKDLRYKEAFDKGVNYIFISQYKNGGWPQFYPVRTGATVAYSGHITYNDNAMVNIMRFLNDVSSDDAEFKSLDVDSSVKEKAKKAFDNGVKCILKTQIVVNGKPTVWCAQHDEKTLLPANARAYELASFSGAESAAITLLLMRIKNPSKEIIAAVEGAVAWFETHKVVGIKQEWETGADGKPNKIIVKDENATPLWGRFYDLQTEKPFFCDRDGIKKNSLGEIGAERRNSYRWYVDDPADVLKKYPEWKNKLK